MSLKRYEQLKFLEKARLEEEEEILRIVEEGEVEFEKGKTKTAKSLKSLL